MNLAPWPSESGLAWEDSLVEKPLAPSGTWCVLQAILIFKKFPKQSVCQTFEGPHVE